MKRMLVFALAFIFIAGIAVAQAPKERTLLWEITGKNLAEPSYLFGTIHLTCPEDLRVPAVVKEKFNFAKQLYLELDLDDPGMMKEVMKGVVMKDSMTLKKLVGKPAYDSLNTVFKKTTGLSLDMMNTMKPILLMSMIYPSLLGCEPDSWEKNFQTMASKRKIELKGLENVSDQLSVLEKIPYKLQAEMLWWKNKKKYFF